MNLLLLLCRFIVAVIWIYYFGKMDKVFQQNVFIITPANKFHYAINPIAQYNQMRSAVYTAPRRQKVSLIFMAVNEQSIFSLGFLHGPYETYHRL